jgi:hypothetical protein
MLSGMYLHTRGAIHMRTLESGNARSNKTQCRLRLLTLRMGISCGFLVFVPAVQADVIFSESFETDGQGTRYTASQPFNVMQSSNGAYWDRGEVGDFNTLLPYANPDGTFFWAAESVDWENPGPGGNGNEVQTIDFGPFNIGGFTDLQFSGLFASTANDYFEPGFPFDQGHGIRVKYSVDSGPFTDGLCFAPVDWSALRNLGHDTNCDGDGNGAVLTADFTGANNPFTFAIPDGATLAIRIEVEAPLASEEVALDLLQVIGDFASIAGDFDLNGRVDGYDFLLWQRGFGSIYDGDDLIAWEANYGTGAPLSADSNAVPEPNSLVLLSLGGLLALWGFRHAMTFTA